MSKHKAAKAVDRAFQRPHNNFVGSIKFKRHPTVEATLWAFWKPTGITLADLKKSSFDGDDS